MSKKFTHFSLKLLKLSKNKHVRRFLNVYSNPRLTVNKSDYLRQNLSCFGSSNISPVIWRTFMVFVEARQASELLKAMKVSRSSLCTTVDFVLSCDGFPLSLFSTVCFHTRDALQSSGTNYPPPLGAFSNFFKTLFTWLLSSNERKTNHHVKRTQLPSNWATV